MNLTLVTGHSRGLGLALTQQLLRQGHAVLGIARRPAPLAHENLSQWQADLTEAAPVAERLQTWLAARAPDAGVLTLIHNAGVMPPLRPLHEVPAADIALALRVGLEAGLLLTAAFLAGTAQHPGARRVLHISSGLGRRAMAASTTYCAAKAGIDHACRALALEYPGVPIVALAPGVFDTDMQQQLRSANPAAFPDQPLFAGLAAEGQLLSTEAAAARVLACLERDDFGREVVADVRS